MKYFYSIILTYLLMGFSFAFAQEDDQQQQFQKFQAMVFIEEANQKCPFLSRLEAEALNGEIVFAVESFAGQLDPVEKFKKEARLFVRRLECDRPEITGFIGLARQAASDGMVNQILLSRQIHLQDKKDIAEGKLAQGLLLNYLNDAEWKMLDEMYEEVKANYLEQADEKAWENYYNSLEKVAEEKGAVQFLTNQEMIKMTAKDDFRHVQALSTNKLITTYYYLLEKTVRAFVNGPEAEEKGYPFSRPANDFTKWTAYRPRGNDLNWALSYQGCGADWDGVSCILFTTVENDIGLVLDGENVDKIKEIVLSFRNSDDKETYRTFKTIESPLGSNTANEENISFNANALEKALSFKAINSIQHNKYKSQTGLEVPEGRMIYVFPKETLSKMEALSKNDILALSIKMKSDVEYEKGLIPFHNYLRAKNWAYTTQF